MTFNHRHCDGTRLDDTRRNGDPEGGADSTIFTTLFGGTESLANFLRNLALMK